MSDDSGTPEEQERARRAEQETARQPAVDPGQGVRLPGRGSQPGAPAAQQPPAAGAPAPQQGGPAPQPADRAYAQRPQQPHSAPNSQQQYGGRPAQSGSYGNPPGPQAGGPQQGHPQPGGPQQGQGQYGGPYAAQHQAPQQFANQQPANQQYTNQQYGQPYQPTQGGGGGLSTPAKLLGWAGVVAAVIAFLACFAPWAKASIDGSYLGRSISVTQKVNAFEHASCSASSGAGEACDDNDSSSSSSASATDDDESVWEGWVISVVALAVVVLGVLRGLGKRQLALPAAIATAVGGLVLLALPIYRLIWIHGKQDDFKDVMSGSSLPSGFDTSLTAGWGLWLVLAMGLVMIAIGGVGALRRQ